ncbi:MAG: hypothetical protein JWQ42_3444 [Edaphobacter sp.]|jgi:uncharacterized membrane protein|nr:hypothetical protein [Edaphobacter sp.]
MAAILAMQGVVSSMWAGIFVVEPSAKTVVNLPDDYWTANHGHI